jgi:subtilase family serine protease
MRTLCPQESSSPSLTPHLCRFFAFSGAALFLLVVVLLTPASRLQSQTPASLFAAPIPDRILDRIDEANLTTIHGSTHPALRHALDNGRLASSTEMADLVLVLTRSEAQQTALETLNKQQYDPASPLYHHWLTPEQFGAAYGPSQRDLNAVTNWLQDHGFTIQEIPPSRTSIRFSGSAAQVETAFHTEMHYIQSNGVAHIANNRDIQIPAALSPVVAGVKALHNYFPKAQHHALPSLSQTSSGTSTGETASLSALSKSGSQQAGVASFNGLNSARPEYSADGYKLLVPYDMATIYNYKSLWTASTPITGTGQTIAIAGTSNIVLSDVATFRAATGLPAKVPTVIITNSDPGTTALLDDRFENTLDVEWSGGAAPGANIVLVTSSQTSATTDALYASESYIINHNVAKIMSVSYGECELWMGTAGNQEYLNLWQQAYSQGIAVFVSSGDSAAAVCDQGNFNPATDFAAQYGPTVSGMTSTPYNVSVGGTDFAPNSAGWSATNSTTNMSNATGYIPEVPWNDTITNSMVINSFNSQQGVSYNAEQWANWMLNNGGIYGGNYDSLIPPVGGSGGVSNCTTSSNYDPSSCGGGYAKPAWQAGVTGILTSDKRTVPDVSFFASAGFTDVAYLICDTQPPNYSTPIPCTYPANALDMAVGGTSVSSPVMAGVMALINQKAGTSQGNPNAQLYALAAKQTYSKCSTETTTNSSSCYFNDIDTGTIATPCFAGSVNCIPQTATDKLGILPGYAATTGYDKATGLGSLNVANVVNGWPATSTSGPAATVSPASLTFASTLVGASSATQTATLTNSGTSALTISAITITSSATAATPFSQTNTCAATLAAKASCTVTVAFKPTAAGSASATLNFTDNAPSSPQSVALSGTGSTPATVSATVSPTSLTFPSTNVGSASATQTVTFTNTGSTPLASLQAVLTGVNAALFKGASGCTGSLAASASCIMNFTFNPTAAGTFTATLTIQSSTSGYTAKSLTLSGTAVAAPTASFSPASLTFPTTAVGASSATQSITLKNTGGAALVLSKIVTGGSNPSSFVQTNSCGTINVGASCTITVFFKPTAAGALSATLTFTDNAANSPQSVSLTGTGIVQIPVASLSITALSFPVIAVSTSGVINYSPAQALTLTNSGNAPLALSSIALGGTNPTSFTQMNNCPASLAAAASCTALIRFAPTATGSKSATLVFTDNASPTSQTVALSGTGGSAPTLTLSSTTLSFPSLTANSGHAVQSVTLANSSATTPLNLTSIALSGTGAASFTQLSNCGPALAPSSTCTLLVQFAPTAKGAQSASIAVSSNNPAATAAVALTGTGQ